MDEPSAHHPAKAAAERATRSHTTSTLARGQQGLVCASLVAAAVWWWAWRGTSTAWAMSGVAVILLGYTAVIALECALMHWLNRSDPAPRLPWAGVVRAWWHETGVAARVFAWQQPFRWHLFADDDQPARPGTRAVVLVHGFVCNRGFWLPWMRELRRRGLAYTSVNLEPVFGSIDECVPRVDDAVRRAHALTGQAPLLVCHSMGGLVARAWLSATPGAAQRVCGVVTIGSPHHGTWLAKFSHLTNGRQMRVGSEWLQSLQAREAGQPQPPFICWYSNGDNVVFPASTATRPGADNRHLPGTSHVALAFHPAVVTATLAILTSPAGSPNETGEA